MRKLKPVTPGELLLEEFLKPMELSRYRLAKEIGVPAQRIGDIVAYHIHDGPVRHNGAPHAFNREKRRWHWYFPLGVVAPAPPAVIPAC